jgi:transposase-like protein
MQTVPDIIDRWPSVAELADDLGEKPNTVSKWRQRKRIPPDQWLPLVTCARKRRIPLDLTTLAKLAQQSGSGG